MKLENKESPLLQYQERDIRRQVYILSSNSLAPRANDIWQVEWEAIDINAKNQKIINRKVYVSTITVEVRANKSAMEESIINPTGFTVVNYNTALKNSKQRFNESM